MSNFHSTTPWLFSFSNKRRGSVPLISTILNKTKKTENHARLESSNMLSSKQWTTQGSISSTRNPILWQHSPFAPPRGWIQKNLDSIIRPLVGEPASVLSPHGPGHLTIPSCPDPISALNYEHRPRNCSAIGFVKWDLRGKHTINSVY